MKNPPANAGDVGSIPGLERSPREGNGNPLQYFYLGNPTDRGAWQVTVHGITKSQTQLIMHAYPLWVGWGHASEGMHALSIMSDSL